MIVSNSKEATVKVKKRIFVLICDDNICPVELSSYIFKLNKSYVEYLIMVVDGEIDDSSRQSLGEGDVVFVQCDKMGFGENSIWNCLLKYIYDNQLKLDIVVFQLFKPKNVNSSSILPPIIELDNYNMI